MEFDYKLPTLLVLDKLHSARSDTSKIEQLKSYLVENGMSTLYQKFSSKGIIPQNDSELAEINAKNKETLKKIEAKKDKDPENESLCFEVDKEISEFHAATLNQNEFISTTKKILKIHSSTSLHMDIFLCGIRIALILQDPKMLESNLILAKELCDRGCDWDRRNKFKVYQAVYYFKRGMIDKSAFYFNETLPTFESTEICTYDKAVLYSIFTGLMSFDRNEIKTKILLHSNILETRSRMHVATKLAETLYYCNYRDLFVDLIRFVEFVEKDLLLGNMINQFCQEIRIRGYIQLLKSYETLSLETMANIFGVTLSFIEQDLVKFIALNRIACKIDRVTMNVCVIDQEANKISDLVEKGDDLIRSIKKKLR